MKLGGMEGVFQTGGLEGSTDFYLGSLEELSIFKFDAWRSYRFLNWETCRSYPFLDLEGLPMLHCVTWGYQFLNFVAWMATDF